MELILVPNDVELNNVRVELDIGTKRCIIQYVRKEWRLVPNDVVLNNVRMELIVEPTM